MRIAPLNLFGRLAEGAKFQRLITNCFGTGREHKLCRTITGRRITNKYLQTYLQTQFDIVIACWDWLAARNNEQLLKALKEEEEQKAAQSKLKSGKTTS